nr:SH3 domain-containing protein [uncultured Treponema sp.]
MKKVIFTSMMLMCAVCSVSAQTWRYVNTLYGVNVRDKPGLDGKKKFVLKCNQRVKLLEETKEKFKIDEFEEPWCKIQTEDGASGYVYGVYLSKTLNDAASFRCYEALHPLADWLEELAEEFTATMYIDKDMHNISSFSDESSFSVQGNGIKYIFYPTKDEKTGKTGSYLLGVRIYENHAMPKDFPIKLGDSMEKVRDIFGKPDGDNFYFGDEVIKAYEGFGNVCFVEMVIFERDDSVAGILFRLSPGF